MRAPMFVFIDELDRCRPTYAIKFLEDVKHLFNIEGIVFVVATDSEQLAHSVKAIYGAEFEARKYLRRFFDRVFVFPDAKRTALVSHLLQQAGIEAPKTFFHFAGNEPTAIITGWADHTRLSNRDLVQCFEIITTFVTSWEHNVAIEPMYLLGLVFAFYADETLTFRILENGGRIENSALSDWTISYQRYDSSSGDMKMSKSNVLGVLQSVAGKKIEIQRDRTSDPSHYEIYLNHERERRFPNGMSYGQSEKSILREYPSRVRNAGRVIDR
ncbi:P-loop NTPase fold protein [Sphingomonas sp. I4]